MLKRFAGYTGKYKKELILAVIFAIAECGFELIIPFLMADMVDVGVANRDLPYIFTRSAIMVVCAVVSLVLGTLYNRMAAVAGMGFGAQLRRAEYEKIQQFSFSNLDHFQTSSIVTRLTSDVNILQNALSNGIRPIVRGPAMIIMGLVMALLINYKLTLVFLVAIPVLAGLLLLIMRKLRPMYGKLQHALDKVNSIVQENLTAIRVVKAYVRGQTESEKFGTVNEELQKTSEKAFGYAVLNTTVFQGVMYATIVCLLWFGGGLVQTGGMQVGQLTGFLSYVLLILNSLMMISGVFMMLTRSITSARRILEIMDEPIDIADHENATNTVQHGSVEFRQVYFKYQQSAKEFVLSNINISIKAGQTIGIIGGTGSAKTSLVQLIPRLYDVSSGQVLVDGHDVKSYPVAHLRNAIAMVLQNNTLFSGTIRENLLWGNPTATAAQIDRACQIACVTDFIDKLPNGLNTVLGQQGAGVSGGQRQRICIARALLKNPKVLILDDSTSAVDTATEARIRAGLASGLAGTTKIIIAQRITSVEHADQIIILENGQINEIGTHQQLLAHNPIYQDIVAAQQKGVAG
ncbi:ABC transporter ATP-binding protein/permease [Ruminococcaceae bacterium OttesenSCG-928-A16]|nr:ABC transporter ATP-binding protein/permease [Ruminococcaceae bacterium OttesenSCG-928-A16]